jgi:hypothetical protein
MINAIRRTACAFGLLALGLFWTPAHCQTASRPRAVVLGVAGIRAQDRELGSLIAEALEVELLQSARVQVVISERVRKAARSLDLEPTELADPADAARLASAIGATHLLVGSCFARENRVVVILRVLDGATGAPVAGGAASAEGAKSDVLPIAKRAAADAMKRLPISGPPSAPGAETGARAAVRVAAAASPPKPAGADDELTPLRAAGLAAASARPGGVLTEKDLAELTGRLAKDLGKGREGAVEVRTPSAPVERVRVLAALVRLALSAENVADRKGALLDGPPDEKNVPAWARPSVEAALDEGWWDEDRPLKPMEPANWAFVAALLRRMPLADLPAPADAPISEGTTGLIVDARELNIQRSSNPRILDEDGQALYPERDHAPNMDYLLQHGLAAYCDDEAKATRAGARPLRVKAIRAAGPGRDDLVVAREDADRIRTEDRRSHFLRRWTVVVLVKGRPASSVTASAPAPSPAGPP